MTESPQGSFFDEDAETRRVFLLTWHKCGSQWIRDLLTHHLILHHTGFANAGLGSFRLRDKDWPDFGERQIAGPIYAASLSEWERYRRPGDRAVLVMRDPRDVVVSMMYSLAYSHVSSPALQQQREGVLRLSPRDRLLVAVARIAAGLPSARSWLPLGWGASVDEGVYVSSYERFVADTEGELGSIVDFLGWRLHPGVVAEAVRELSFENRSGRARGDEDVFSHYRKGCPGDWVNHFTFAAGFALDLPSPGFLVESGYESDPNWYERLDRGGEEGGIGAENAAILCDRIEKEAELVRLREENAQIRALLTSHGAPS